MKKQILKIIDCGTISYKDGLDLQKQYLNELISGHGDNTVLILQHTPVITQGARETENKFLIDEDIVKAQGVEIFDVRRGGGTTAHNPGQLVFYPIIDLRSVKLGINEFIRLLEQIGMDFLNELGVIADRRKGYPGLWVNEKKIASIGVRVDRGCTYHGMAINVSNDLEIFKYIVPCGLDNVTMVSVKSLTQKQYNYDNCVEILSKILKNKTPLNQQNISQ